MTQYEDALRAINYLLHVCGETAWAARITADLDAWLFRGDSRPHLAAFRGMGSLNDVTLSRENGHTVTREQEPWLNEAFGCLISLSYRFGSNTSKHWTGEALRREFERPLVMSRNLKGWRCLACGYAETSDCQIAALAAHMVLPDMLFEAAERRGLLQIVQRLYDDQLVGSRDAVRRVSAGTTVAGISIANRSGWMRPCPACNSYDTAVYSWDMTQDDRLVPTANNLPLS